MIDTPDKTSDILLKCRSWIDEDIMKEKERAYCIEEMLAGGATPPFKIKKVKDAGIGNLPTGLVVEITKILSEGPVPGFPTYQALTDVKEDKYEKMYTCIKTKQWRKV